MPIPVPGPPPAGRLLPPGAAPAQGERTCVLVEAGGARVEQILSGQVAVPVDYCQDHAEWVLLLSGAAELEVDGSRRALGPGDWLLLPAGRPHRLTAVRPQTAWLAVHLPPPPATQP